MRPLLWEVVRRVESPEVMAVNAFELISVGAGRVLKMHEFVSSGRAVQVDSIKSRVESA